MLPRTNCSYFGSQILWLFFIIVLLRHASIPLVEKVKLHIVVAGASELRGHTPFDANST